MRIWFNHWFSTVTQIFDLIREAEDRIGKVEIIATNDKMSPTVQSAADEWSLEPNYSEYAYIDWCRSFIRKNKIDIFIPRRHRDWVSKHKDIMGCTVVCEDYSTEEVLNDKIMTYKMMASSGDKEIADLVPDFKVGRTAFEVYDGFLKLRDTYDRVCMKKAQDEGAASFLEVIKKPLDYTSLVAGMYEGRKMWINTVVNILTERQEQGLEIADFMLMPYLEHEVSCDCIEYNGEFICVVREDGPNHTTIVTHDKKYVELAKKLYSFFNMKGIANIQFRHTDSGEVKLLEINTRMSGGIQKSCLAANLNFPEYLVAKFTGLDVNVAKLSDFRVYVASESRPKIISEER